MCRGKGFYLSTLVVVHSLSLCTYNRYLLFLLLPPSSFFLLLPGGGEADRDRVEGGGREDEQRAEAESEGREGPVSEGAERGHTPLDATQRIAAF